MDRREPLRPAQSISITIVVVAGRSRGLPSIDARASAGPLPSLGPAPVVIEETPPERPTEMVSDSRRNGSSGTPPYLSDQAP